MSAASGQRNAKLTMEVLNQIRNDVCFKAFYETVLLKNQPHTDILGPKLSRKRKAPARFEVGSEEHFYPQTAEDHYRQISFEALDLESRSDSSSHVL